MQLNNPFNILSLQVLGVGLEVTYYWSTTTRGIELSLSLAVWNRSWDWSLK